MTHALAEHYGRWAAGWRWAHDEGDFDGGPVGNWSRPQYSVTAPEETLDRVTAALCEWREWLESLAARFEAYPLDLAGIDDQRILWGRTARNLILHVTDRTGCGSGWYAHCHQVLGWFLSRSGVPADDAERLVEQAIGGRFESWTGTTSSAGSPCGRPCDTGPRRNGGGDPHLRRRPGPRPRTGPAHHP
jgi:hypothetical protein